MSKHQLALRIMLIAVVILAVMTALHLPVRAQTSTCVVSYNVPGDWGSGFTADVTIKNMGATAINGWTLTWTFPGNQQITNLWNGTYTQSGASVSVTNTSYNAGIGANGGTVNFGFNANYSGTNAKPTNFALNGVMCNDGSGPTNTPAATATSSWPLSVLPLPEHTCEQEINVGGSTGLYSNVSVWVHDLNSAENQKFFEFTGTTGFTIPVALFQETQNGIVVQACNDYWPFSCTTVSYEQHPELIVDTTGCNMTSTPPATCLPTNTPTLIATATQKSPPPANLALNQPAVASSAENSSLTAPNAVDGHTGTRWSSRFSDPQWIQVDLGATYAINRIVLRWEAAYGRAYQIQVSDDASSWTTIYTTSSGNGGVDDLSGLSGSGRFVRMYGTTRGTPWGYSLWEFEIYGEPAAVPEGMLVDYSGCKETPPPDATPVPGSGNDCIEYHYDSNQSILSLKHINASFNCCPLEIVAEITIGQQIISIVEAQVFNGGTPCPCLCLRDIDYEITNLPAGEYTIHIGELSPGSAFEFTVDLDAQPSGSYCVQRSVYPWLLP